jgi:hypothetical protein
VIHPAAIAAPTMPAVFCSAAATTGVRFFSKGIHLSACADSAARDEQVGQIAFSIPQARWSPRPARSPALFSADGRCRAVFGLLTADLDVAELGVGQQHPVVDHSRPDAGAEGFSRR